MTTTEEAPELEFRSDVTVDLVKHSAADSDVLFAARVSTLGETASRDESRSNCEHQGPECMWSRCGLNDRDKGLINYLMRDRHGSPFEHNSMTFRITAPIFVFREFMRHRVGWSYNEESGRYAELKPVFYIPGPDRKLVQQGKPGKYEFVEGPPTLHGWMAQDMAEAYDFAYHRYQRMLERGVAREVARSVLPVGLFSTMYATCNARSLMHFLGLRTTHPEAKVPSFPQREIEMVGQRMETEWEYLMPVTHGAFNANGRVAP